MSPWVSEDRLLAVEERRFVVLLAAVCSSGIRRMSVPRASALEVGDQRKVGL